MPDHILESNRPNILVIRCQRCKAGKMINTEITEDGYLAVLAKADEIMAERKAFLEIHEVCQVKPKLFPNINSIVRPYVG